MSSLSDQLDRWRPFAAVVVGDFMLDELVYGDAERLSPDAPVPVLRVRHTEHRAGGAANLALAIAALRGSVRAVGVTGRDDAARRLRQAIEPAGVTTEGLVVDPARPTTVKRSYVGLAQHRHPQKMFRVDFESRDALAADVAAALLDALPRALQGADVVCLEDYGKGVCTASVCAEVIAKANQAGIPVFVDPAPSADYAKYRGSTVITPNRTEAEIATGHPADGEQPDRLAAMGRQLLARCDVEAVVLTLDRHGAMLVLRDGSVQLVPTVARAVYDVSGAGDVFLAALAAARVNGCAWPDAVRFANAAAGLEVEIFGVEPVPFERVRQFVQRQDGRVRGKLLSLEQVLAEADARRRRGARIVFTNGCFDLLHSGHVSLLERAAALGDYLIVGINDDASAARLKGPGRPVQSQFDRARVLGALEAVDAVVLFSDDTPIRLIEQIRPDVLVKGADYTRDQVVGASLVESLGGRVVLIDLVEGYSTTATVERLRRG